MSCFQFTGGRILSKEQEYQGYNLPEKFLVPFWPSVCSGLLVGAIGLSSASLESHKILARTLWKPTGSMNYTGESLLDGKSQNRKHTGKAESYHLILAIAATTTS